MAAKHFQLLILLAIALAGCATPPERIVVREPVEVRVPVAVRATPPASLIAPYRPVELPTFVAPSDDAAAAALTAEGLAQLRVLLRDLVTRERAWRSWAIEPPQ